MSSQPMLTPTSATLISNTGLGMPYVAFHPEDSRHRPLPKLTAPNAPPEPTSYDRPLPYVREPKIGRNDPCPCGSCKKYKKCCGKT